MQTEQEEFWRGDFGTEYVSRNILDYKRRIPFWTRMLDLTQARSILEVGCNIGTNLKAMRAVDPTLNVWGCDINQAALQQAADAGLSVVDASLFDIEREFCSGQFDLVASVGVLIHVAPADLERAMRAIIAASGKYVLAVEYEAEHETEVEYRGHAERLWKRPYSDFYERLGLRLRSFGEADEEAFDRCHFTLLEKP